jgi:HK97 gp10 family phage protein
VPVNTVQVDNFARRLAAASQGIEAVEEVWQDQWGPEVASQMRNRAPRDTGALAASITYDGNGTVRVGVDYGHFVEYGTARMAPQPYMKPSVDKVRPEATRDAGHRAVDII